MRKFKFRVYNKESELMSEPFSLYNLRAYDDDKHITMAYTGMRDMEGAEIYEGDMLSWERTSKVLVGEIAFDESIGGWTMLGLALVTSNITKNCRIVGDIFNSKGVSDE